jgi:catechol 2,3-dioxygenase-like lactoylglutathione lyase family enzyme
MVIIEKVSPVRQRNFTPLLVIASLTILIANTASAQRGPVKYDLPVVKHPLPLETNSVGIYGLEHTHVITGNIERAVHFYVDLLGFHQVTPIRDLGKDGPMNEMLGFGGKASFRTVMLAQPGGASYGQHVPGIEMWEISGVPLDKTLYNNPAMNLQGKGYNAYRVKDLKSLVAKLQAAGIKTVSKQVYLTPEISGIYTIDPDGQIVELDQFPKPFGEK